MSLITRNFIHIWYQNKSIKYLILIFSHIIWNKLRDKLLLDSCWNYVGDVTNPQSIRKRPGFSQWFVKDEEIISDEGALGIFSILLILLFI